MKFLYCVVKIKFQLIGLSIFAISCMNNPVQYEYADSNGNRYHINSAELEYIPVTPAESSSGIYSGGEPKTVSISPGDYKTLHEIFQKAINNQEIHILNRVMMSGSIRITESSETTRYLIQPGCKEQIDIESTLKGILSK